MSRSFLSHQVDFRTPYETQILRKSRKRKTALAAFWGIGGWGGDNSNPDSVSDASWGMGGGDNIN